ncbi:MAG: TenA family transcriptional regulator [Acidobacteriota bacterium]
MPKSGNRSPRRTNFHHPALAEQSLSTEAPAEDSISWRLWTACADLAQRGLETDYIQGIAHGSLHPNDYGRYTVQDAAYCAHAAADYQTIEKRALAAGEDRLAAFAQARYAGYQAYDQQVFEQWHLRGGDAVRPSPAAQTYIDFEHRAAESLAPVYGVLAMVPCDELWPWLATELKPSAVPTNLYSFWIEENADWHGAYRLDNSLDAWFADHPDVFDWDTALWVMRSGMTCEVNLFRSACGQSLVEMPKRPSS